MMADKVIWSEGMFLRPHHFQRQELWMKCLFKSIYESLGPYLWGLIDYQIDTSLLKKGKFGLNSAKGVFDDGTFFEMQTSSELPQPLSIESTDVGQRIVLALPAYSRALDNIEFGELRTNMSRLKYYDREVNDLNEVAVGRATIQFGRYDIQLMLERDVTPDLTILGISKIFEVTHGGEIIIDNEYIPPLLNCNCNKIIKGYINELEGLVNQKSEQISNEIKYIINANEIEQDELKFLLILNRYVGQLNHSNRLPHIHPENLFKDWLQFATELATLTADRGPFFPLPCYEHDDLGKAFSKLMKILRQNLLLMMQRNYIQLEIDERSPNLYVAVLPASINKTNFGLILAVKTDMPSDELQQKFPAQMKIGPGKRIRDLVELHLPGVNLKLMPSAPRQIPWKPDYVYFEIEKKGELWEQIINSSALVMHLAGDFPSLDMELWAVKQNIFRKR